MEDIKSHFGAFSSVALNVNYPVAPHYDENDYSPLMCWVIPFGDFTGGELVLHEGIDQQFVVEPGDLIAFRSDLLQHSVCPFNGTRNSVVLFTCRNLLKDQGVPSRSISIERKTSQ